jgi:hypothetical protein
MKDVNVRMRSPQMQRYPAPLVITWDNDNRNALLSEINKWCKCPFEDARGNPTTEEDITPMNDQIDGLAFCL